ncbi:MAG: alpha/beta fold hydrolase [Flavobacteriales bacterium]|nr:alpha/beta fold hydrolase [Flavobacteriales bacterium]
MITQPTWLDRSEFPFTSRTFEHTDGRLHYVDEGQGPILLFVHGTPDWSFGFRHLVKEFRGDHRCIAIDHLGFGLSDKPENANYTTAAHARRLRDFIDHQCVKMLCWW